MKNIALFASGSGSNVENIANYFQNDSTIKVSLVLTNNPNAFVVNRAKRLGLDCHVFNKQDFLETTKIVTLLQEYRIDLIVLAGFLLKVPVYLIKAFPNKIINIHPALLPKYGGKGMYGINVHRAVVAAKEKETGITIHYVNEKYDEGKIIFQATCIVEPADTAEDVAQKIHALEFANFPKEIAKILV